MTKTTKTRSERAKFAMDEAYRDFRLLMPTIEYFFTFKEAEAAWLETADGINYLMSIGHHEGANAAAIRNYGYDGNAAAVPARSHAKKTSRALATARDVSEELPAAMEGLAAAKQERTKARAQVVVDDILGRLSALVEEAEQHAALAAIKADAAVEKSQRVAFQAPSAKKALDAAMYAQAEVPVVKKVLADAIALAAGEPVEKETHLPESGDELLHEADYLDDRDYDDYEESVVS